MPAELSLTQTPTLAPAHAQADGQANRRPMEPAALVAQAITLLYLRSLPLPKVYRRAGDAAWPGRGARRRDAQPVGR